MKVLKLAVAVAALTAGMNANAAGAIDLFTDPVGGHQVVDASNNSLVMDNATNFVEHGPFPSSILGGYRDMKVIANSGASNFNNTTLTVNAGVLTFNNDSGVNGTGILQWDGLDNSSALNTIGLGGIDLLALGSAFNFHVLAADLGFSFAIGLYDMAGNSTVFDLASNAGEHTTSIAFDFFDNAQSQGVCGQTNFNATIGHVNSVSCVGDVDLTNLGAMEITLNTTGVLAVDFEIESITAVPEPSSLALLGLGLIASGFSSRKKIKA